MTARTEIVWRSLAASGAIVFVLLTVAAFRHPDLGVTARIVMGTLLVATAIRPAIGLMMAVALLPLVPPIQLRLDLGHLAEPNLMFMAPLLGVALMRLAAARELPRSRLQFPAMALIAVLIGDAVTRLPMAAPRGIFTRDFGAALWHQLTAAYFSDPGSFESLHVHVGWIAAITFAVIAELVMRAEPRVRTATVRLALVSGAVLALFSVNRVIEVALRSTEPLDTARAVVTSIRFTPFHRDINAAGSLYVLLAVPPLWRAISSRGYGYALAAVPLLLAVWFSGSRTAFIAAPVGLIAAWLFSRRMRRPAAMVGLAAVVAAALVLTFINSRTGQAGAGTAVEIRLDLLKVGLQVTSLDPAFGVGLDRFKTMSARFITPDLANRFPQAARGENAHNNFVQVLAELGVVGLAAFLWVLVTPAVLAARSSDGGPPNAAALIGGLAAFAFTCLGGHPMLSDHVRWCFFLVLGLSAGLLQDGQSSKGGRVEERAAAAAALVVLASLLFRL